MEGNIVMIPVTEELADRIERATYICRGRRDIIKAVLKDKEGGYNTELLEYYQKLYEDSYLEFRQMVEYVNSCVLSEFEGRTFRWSLEYCTSTIKVIFIEPESHTGQDEV